MFRGDVIRSNQNPSVVRFSKLRDAKHRRSEGLFLCEGIKLAHEALRCGIVRYLLVREDMLSLCEETIALPDSAELVVLAEGPFSKISTENAPQGVIAVCGCDIVREYETPCGTAFMCSSIRDPGNLGTIIRTAAAFGYDSVLLHDCADVYNSKTVRASMGGIFRTRLISLDDPFAAISDLQRGGRRVFAAALEKDSRVLGDFEICASDVFIVGNEGHGLDPAVIAACDSSVVIPMFSGVDSLNAALASCVILWEQRRTFS